MNKAFILFIIIYSLTTVVSSAKDYISKNPNYIKRGSLWGSAHVANYHKNSKKHNYTIIKDPTGTSPIEIVEKFAPRKGDCSDKGHFGGAASDCNTGRLRLEIGSGKKGQLSKAKIKRKPEERWYGYYLYIPEDFPEDIFLQPYINQFYGCNKNCKGGYPPHISASIFKGKLGIYGEYIIDEKNLKGQWHKIEYHIRWSTQNDGFVKVYYNNELKLNRDGYTTMTHDYVQVKYGTYSFRDGYPYPENYTFPSHTIYFAGFSVSKKREHLKVNKIK
tara:strand:- start:60 stop:884 length:825 start_codon:yes stop_codon:yes gene_type:complete